MAKKSLYTTLGISSHASAEDIKKAFRRLAKQHHPDKNQNSKKSEELFKEIKTAYSILSSAHKRKEYDLKMRIENSNFQTNSNISPTYRYAYNVVRNMDNERKANNVENEFKLDFSALIISIIVALAFVMFIVLLKI